MQAGQCVARERLFHELERGTRGALTLIRAPAGFGKTVLASSWLHTRGLHAAWLSLERGENEPGRFWRYLIAALQQIHPALSKHQACDPETELVRLLNALMALPEKMVLVLDNFQHIAEGSIQQALVSLLSYRPSQLHLIIITRYECGLPLARLRMEDQVYELDARDLRFTLDEARALLAARVPAFAEAQTLHRQVGGWAAGLLCSARAWERRENAAEQRYIQPYLAEEVLADLPEQARSCLLLTSLVERFNAHLCEVLTGQGQEMLTWLVEVGAFLIQDEVQGWYHYDQQIGEALRQQAQQEYPHLVPALHQQASAWYEQQRMIEEAIEHARLAADHERAASLMERHAWHLLNTGHVEALAGPLWQKQRALLALSTGREEQADTDPQPTEKLIDPLSEREQMVLQLISQGHSNQEIARQLVVTVNTVKTHLHNIYAKMLVHTRLQAVIKAREIGLLETIEAPLLTANFEQVNPMRYVGASD